MAVNLRDVHYTAVCDAGAVIREGAKVWHFCHLSENCCIGQNTVLGQNVFVGKGVRIGDRVKVQNNVTVCEGVTLEDDVFVGPSVMFTNVKNPRSEYPVNGVYVETLVKKGATIGANATIVCGVTIGEYAFVGAGAVVTHDVPPYTMVAGNPARKIGEVDKQGIRKESPQFCLSGIQCYGMEELR